MTPWSQPYREQAWRPTRMQNASHILVMVLQVVLVIVGGWLARRNLVLGRGDRRGAARLGLALFALGIVVWILEAHHVADRQEMTLMARAAGSALLFAGIMWLFYLALEPYVRRFWPATLISWTRLLTSGPNDPLIGRDILFGMSWGAAIALLFGVPQLVLRGIGPQPTPHIGRLGGTLSLQSAGANLLSLWFNGLVLAMGSLLLMLLLKLVLKREWLGASLLVGVLTSLQALGMGGDTRLWWSVPLSLLVMGSFVWLLMRAGLVACIVGVVAANLLGSFPLTLDFAAWHGGLSALIFASVALLAAFAFRTGVYGMTYEARPRT